MLHARFGWVRVLLLLVCVVSSLCAQSVSELERQLQTAAGRERVAVLAELLTRYRDGGPIERAIQCGMEAVRLLEVDPEARMEARVRIDLSAVLSRRGRNDDALVHAQRGVALAEQLADDELVGLAAYHLAVAQWRRSQLDEAIASAERARLIHEELADPDALATTLTLLGAIHRSRSAYDLALACHLEALEIATTSGNSSTIARSRNNVGLVYWKLDELDRALEYLESVPATYRELGRDRQLAAALSNLGLIHIERGYPEVALSYLAESREVHRSIEEPRSLARVLSNLGFAHEQLGDNAKALEFHFETLEIREGLEDQWGLSRTLSNIASIYRESGSVDVALEYSLRALTHAEEFGARSEQSVIHKQLADVYADLGQFERALESMREHRRIADELDATEFARRVANSEARKKVAELEGERARQRLQLAHQRDRQVLLWLVILAVSAVAVSLFALWRIRVRALVVERASHAEALVAAERIQESERKYRSVFESPVPRLLIDLSARRVVDANGAAGALCDTSAAAMEGLRWDECGPGWLVRALRTVDDSLKAATCQLESWTSHDDEVQHVEIWITPVSLRGRSCAVVAVHDVTEDRRLEEQRIRVDKLESLGLLAGGIAHDFNNALAAVLGHVSLAQTEVAEHGQLPGLLAETEQAIHRAAGLTSQLLAFAKGGEPRREIQDVGSLLRESVKFALSGSNVRVEFRIADDLWLASLDQGQFKQAISNVVINADQAMVEGGRLVVCASNVVTDKPLGPDAAAGPYVRIDITDSGPGVPQEVRDRILDPYFSTKPDGMGLGLATTYAVVSRHHGWMDFDSAEFGGATFSLFFRAAPDERIADVSAAKGELLADAKVLVMDDDPGVRGVFERALASMGHVVEAVDCGEAAIDRYFAAKASDRPFDVVIMDLTVPGRMGGKATMAELRRRDRSVTGIVSSGYSSDSVMSDFASAGFAAALPKPFSISDLKRVMAQAMRRRATPSESEPPT